MHSRVLRKLWPGSSLPDGCVSRGGSAEPDTSEMTSFYPQHEVPLLLAKTGT